MDQGYAVIIAAMMAIAGIFYTSRQQRKMLRKQHTFKVIEKLSGWDQLDACNTHAGKLAKRGKMPSLARKRDTKDCEKLDFLLNYYEVLASAIICGDVDEELMRRMERSRLVRCYLQFLPYIEENRSEMKTEEIWENLEFITYRWTVTRVDPADSLIDRVRMRPTVEHLSARRDELSTFLWKKRALL